MDTLPDTTLAQIMFCACDGLFDAPLSVLSANFMGESSEDATRAAVVTFVRAHYLPIQRMRCVSRSTVNATWLMSEVALYIWLKENWRAMVGHGRCYEVDYHFREHIKRLEPANPKHHKAIRAAIRVWLAQPEESVMKIRRARFDDYKTNGVDRKILSSMNLTAPKDAMHWNASWEKRMDFTKSLLTAARDRKLVCGEEKINIPIVYKTKPENAPEEVRYLDEMEWISPAPDGETDPYKMHHFSKCIHHLPSGVQFSGEFFLRHLFASGDRANPMAFEDMKRTTLERALRRQHRLKKNMTKLRAKLKERIRRLPKPKKTVK